MNFFRVNQNLMSLKIAPQTNLEPEMQNDETETYLLTNKGLEKLDIEKEINVNVEGDEKNAIKENNEEDKDQERSQMRTNYDARELSRMVRILGFFVWNFEGKSIRVFFIRGFLIFFFRKGRRMGMCQEILWEVRSMLVSTILISTG